MKEIIRYEAIDGTIFTDKEACIEYENNSREKIVSDFKELIVREGEGYDITNGGNAFPMAEIAECWQYAVILLKNKGDYETLIRFVKNVSPFSLERIKEIYNTEILVSLGDRENDKPLYNFFRWYGTVDEAIEQYKRTLLTFNIG